MPHKFLKRFMAEFMDSNRWLKLSRIIVFRPSMALPLQALKCFLETYVLKIKAFHIAQRPAEHSI